MSLGISTMVPRRESTPSNPIITPWVLKVKVSSLAGVIVLSVSETKQDYKRLYYYIENPT